MGLTRARLTLRHTVPMICQVPERRFSSFSRDFSDEGFRMQGSIGRALGSSIAMAALIGGLAVVTGCASTAGHPVRTTAEATTGHPSEEGPTGQVAEDEKELADKARDAGAASDAG